MSIAQKPCKFSPQRAQMRKLIKKGNHRGKANPSTFQTTRHSQFQKSQKKRRNQHHLPGDCGQAVKLQNFLCENQGWASIGFPITFPQKSLTWQDGRTRQLPPGKKRRNWSFCPKLIWNLNCSCNADNRFRHGAKFYPFLMTKTLRLENEIFCAGNSSLSVNLSLTNLLKKFTAWKKRVVLMMGKLSNSLDCFGLH